MSSTKLTRWSLPLRDWQREACDQWWLKKPQDSLIVACPGAGKTRFAMRLSHALLEARLVQRVVIVVPKDHLKGQVARSMIGAGITLDPGFENSVGTLSSDLQGAVVSYQQVAFAPMVFRRMVRAVPTLVILDEVHHAGDDATWGKALRDAFDGAAYRVSMSGTPFRSDGTPIPFVSYDRGLCVPDYSYDYSRALKDGVCRPLTFALHGVQAEWISRDGIAVEATFDTALENKRQESERLRTALTQEGWIGMVIARANEQLHAVRKSGHSDAAGLIVCMNQEHARAVAKLVHRFAGVEPMVVVSEDEDASAKIRKFATSRQPWVVAVHMISEGVDIPRLRVGVYATNVGTPMYFRQFCGRFVRSQSTLSDEQHAFIFMADDPSLRPLAASIHIEVQGHLKAKREFQGGLDSLDVGEADAATDDFYSAIAAHATDNGVLHGHPTLFAIPGMTRTQPTSYFSDDAAPIAAASAAAISSAKEEKQDVVVDLLEQKRAIRREINVLVSRVKTQFNVDHRKIHGSLNNRFGGSLATASKHDLEKRRGELLRWITKNVYDGFK
jgi:superfamily II DNA or RNA helicase